MQNCHFDVRSRPGGSAFGLFLGNTKESIITGNLIYAGGNPGFKACIWVWGDMVNIANNQLRPWWYNAGDSGNGVVVGDAARYPSKAMTITDNIIWELQNGTGIWLQSGTSECRVIGNTFKDCNAFTRVLNQGDASNQIGFN